MISLLLLCGGDRSNGLEWGRYVLLVHRRIRRCETPHGLSFCSHRCTNNPCDYFVPSPGILLLSDLGFERFASEHSTVIVDLCNYRDLDRASKLSLFSEQPDSVVALRSLCFKPSGHCGAGSRQAHCHAIRLKFGTPNVCDLVRDRREVHRFEDSSLCAYPSFCFGLKPCLWLIALVRDTRKCSYGCSHCRLNDLARM